MSDDDEVSAWVPCTVLSVSYFSHIIFPISTGLPKPQRRQNMQVLGGGRLGGSGKETHQTAFAPESRAYQSAAERILSPRGTYWPVEAGKGQGRGRA